MKIQRENRRIFIRKILKKKYERKNKKDVNQYASDSDDLFKFDTSEDENRI